MAPWAPAESLEVLGACVVRAWYSASRPAASKTQLEDFLDWLEAQGYDNGDRRRQGTAAAVPDGPATSSSQKTGRMIR